MSGDDGSPDAAGIPLQERLQAHLLQDLSLADTLSRGLVNLSRTARWLGKKNGWDERANEIVQALRSHADAAQTPPWRQGRRLLADTNVGLETGSALVTVKNTLTVRERLEDAWVHLSTLPRASIIEYRGCIRLIATERGLAELREILPQDSIRDEQAPASTITLTLPDEPGALSVVGSVVTGFLHHGIPILHVTAADRRTRLLIPGGNLNQAYSLALMMTDPPQDWGRGLEPPPPERDC